MIKARRLLPPILALLLVCAVYANHFHGAFHFDDSHTVVNNPHIRSLSSIPRFFSDGRTFSSHPLNQGWRPLVSTSLALDYWMGGGLTPLWFHVSTFVCYLLMLGCTYALFRQVMRRADLALYATTLFAVHPAMAETVNYVIQRADLYVAWGEVASLALFAAGGRARTWGLYLVPFVLAGLCKPTALALPLLVLLYLCVFERPSWRAMLPSIAVAIALALLHRHFTPPTYTTGNSAAGPYLLTQPYVALHFVRTLFLPTALSADTDWAPCASLWDPRALAGLAFLAVLLVAAVRASRSAALKPAGFGLGWFIVTMLPTSLTPLAEVTNDHRMFGPFVGLALAATWTGARALERLGPSARRWARAAALVLLVAFAWGTHVRNEVWRTDQSLWADVVRKSPRNGRGWMNYGVALMEKGRVREALDCFERGLDHAPRYAYLYTNLGVAHGALGHRDEAERAFGEAMRLDVTSSAARFYGRWLLKQGRRSEAARVARQGLARNPDDAECLALLVEAGRSAVDAALQAVAESRTPETLLQLSLAYHDAKQYPKCIDAAREALALRPRYAEAWNNVAAAYLGLERWDDAIDASRRALAIRPDLEIARNNLRYAERMKGTRRPETR